MTILNEQTLDFVSSSLEQTIRLGVRLGELLKDGDCLCLSGELGAGKTTFARGIGRGWGTAVRVTSPTYTLINHYPRARDGRTLYHIDAYRLESEGDVFTSGLEDIFDQSGAFMIEWPEQIKNWLPESYLWIQLSYFSETRRHLRFEAFGKAAETVLKGFKQNAFGV